METPRSKFYIAILIITTSLFLTTHAEDTITASQTITDSESDDETIISSLGTFVLGFFTPGNTSTNRYVGIWYKGIAQQTVVWVANRDDPIAGRSGVVRFNESGHLVLVNATNGSIIWYANSSTGVRNPVAQLLDSGNLVVREANGSSFAWQSFDYPTDTFLPGMNLGKNLVTGQEFNLISWKTSTDPARGDYICSFEPSGYPQLISRRRRNGNIIYRAGPWNGVGYSGFPDLQRTTYFTLSAVVNKNEAYYRYRVNNGSILVRIVLSELGVGRRWAWSGEAWSGDLSIPIDDCDSYSACGPNGRCNIKNSPVCECLSKFKPNDPQAWAIGETSSGCNRTAPLDCQKGDGFLRYTGVKLPDTNSSWYDEAIDLMECKDLCLSNCNCSAYSSLNISEGASGCLHWFGDLMDIRDTTPGQEIYIRVASSELGSDRKRKVLIITLSLVAGLLLLIVSLMYSCKRKKLDQNLLPKDYYDGQGGEDLDVPIFNLSSIIKATDNFSNENKLGEGGFGPVYKGLLEDGQMIAVKRLSGNSDQGVDEFKNEVICIAELRHRNLVKLVGYCIRGKEMMLVYEYMKNKSLDFILFDPKKAMLLDWPKRLNIINGIARGLLYLHQDSRLRVIHRDLKTSNILLDSDMNPRISDFGLARTFGGNETGANTKRIVGTYGYMSPEYAGDGVFSVKSDVFSFGVIFIEIAWTLQREERSLELVDPCLTDSINVLQVLRSIHVGLLCVQEHPDDRPTMSSVVQMLSNDAMILPQPKHPGFFIQRDVAETEILVTSSAASSANRITHTVLEGR